MMKNIYKNVKLIDSDDKKVFFSGLNELSVILNKNSVSDWVFNKNNKFARIDQILETTSIMILKYDLFRKYCYYDV